MFLQAYNSRSRPNMSNGHAETADGNLVIFETALWAQGGSDRRLKTSAGARRTALQPLVEAHLVWTERPQPVQLVRRPRTGSVEALASVWPAEKNKTTHMMLLFPSSWDSLEITAVKTVERNHYLFSMLHIYLVLMPCRIAFKRST